MAHNNVWKQGLFKKSLKFDLIITMYTMFGEKN
jgi:hypothetical protein